MHKICLEAEAAMHSRQEFIDMSNRTLTPTDSTTAVAIAAVNASLKCVATAMICKLMISRLELSQMIANHFYSNRYYNNWKNSTCGLQIPTKMSDNRRLSSITDVQTSTFVSWYSTIVLRTGT